MDRPERMQLLADLISRAPEAVAALLADRAEEAPPAGPGRERIEERRTPGGSYCLELVNCGKCKRCHATNGPVHGPYWYFYGRRDNGRRYSRYVGKVLRTIEEIDAEKSARDQGES
jgi:hypothetical protein